MPIAYKGEYHIRSGATKQQLRGVALQQFILKKMGLSWDDVIHPTATIECIDDEAVRYFLQNAVEADRLPEKVKNSSVEQVFTNMDLMDNEGHLKNAAVLLFAKSATIYFCIGIIYNNLVCFINVRYRCWARMSLSKEFSHIRC